MEEKDLQRSGAAGGQDPEREELIWTNGGNGDPSEEKEGEVIRGFLGVGAATLLVQTETPMGGGERIRGLPRAEVAEEEPVPNSSKVRPEG